MALDELLHYLDSEVWGNEVWAIGVIIVSIWLFKVAVKGECEKGDRILLFFGALTILVGALWIFSWD